MLRPISMVIPDYRLVCENMLYAFGFHTAPVLAKKVSTIYKIFSE
jgi:dynein heavy chain